VHLCSRPTTLDHLRYVCGTFLLIPFSDKAVRHHDYNTIEIHFGYTPLAMANAITSHCMSYAKSRWVLSAFSMMTVFGLSNDLDLVPSWSILWDAHDPSPSPKPTIESGLLQLTSSCYVHNSSRSLFFGHTAYMHLTCAIPTRSCYCTHWSCWFSIIFSLVGWLSFPKVIHSSLTTSSTDSSAFQFVPRSTYSYDIIWILYHFIILIGCGSTFLTVSTAPFVHTSRSVSC
jgi:hypothetical protein